MKHIPQSSVSYTRRHVLKSLTGVLAFPLRALCQSPSTQTLVAGASQNDGRFTVIHFSPTFTPSVVLVNSGFASCQIAIEDTLLAVGNYLGGQVALYDLSNPQAPNRLGSINTGLSGIGALSLRGMLVAVGELTNPYQARVGLLDFSNPASPRLLGIAQTPFISTIIPQPPAQSDQPPQGTAAISSIGFLGDRLLVAAAMGDFTISKIDFANPSMPSVSTFPSQLGNPPQIDVNSQLNLIAAGDSGGGMIKLFNGSSNALISSFFTSLPSVDSIALSNTTIIASSSHGPQAVKISLADHSMQNFLPLPQDSNIVVALDGQVAAAASPYSSHVSLSNLTAAPAVLAIVDAQLYDINTVAVSTIPYTAPAAALSYSPLTLSFPNVRIDTEAQQIITLRNTGQLPLHLMSPTFIGINFRLLNVLPQTILPGQSATLDVAFRPDSTNLVDSMLTFTTNAPTSPKVAIPLFGQGAQYQPTVIDGTFELGRFSQPWLTYAPGPGFVAQVTTEAAHGGRYGLEETGATGLVYQDIYGLVSGQCYDVLAWVRIPQGSTATALLSAHDTLEGNYVQSATVDSRAAFSWIQIGVNFRADSTLKLRVHLVRHTGSGPCYWDDVQIFPSLFACLAG